MTDIGNTQRKTAPGAFETVREVYGFACLHCGYAWKQTYDIEQHIDRDNKPFFIYYTNGERVPSPLSMVTCVNCDEHKVRVARADQISAMRSAFPFTQDRRF
ncbi:hypothetical protein [Streptomyces durbertensis]|uniref:hypothetical protein n=1 Tax=Streptomyces durbertensis TaxID=2448886 RepID=UPI002B2050C4|nr:hypothetical protein [Streptomyces durbertensis]